MRKKITAGAVLLLLWGCGGGDPDGPAPTHQDNACSILDQRPGWDKAFLGAQRQWGIPVETQMAIIWKESSFRQHARPRKEKSSSSSGDEYRSSAYGYSQALDGTWEWYQDSTGNHGDKRTDIDDAANFIGWYANQSRKRNGIMPNDAYNLYLSYHQGHSGYNRGSYQNQPWLKQVARQVQVRSDLYARQLPYCL